MKGFGLIVQYICLATVLGAAIWQDVRTRKIKNQLCVSGVLVGFASALILPERHILDALAGFFVMLGVGMLCWKLHVFRAGDAKLLCAVGSFTDWKMGINCLLIAVIIGAFFGVPLIILRLKKGEGGRTAFPFSVAVAAGCVFGLVFGYLWELIEFM